MNILFKPAWWLNSPHLQTLWSSLFRAKNSLIITNERIELNDGDFIDLGWAGFGAGPRVLILHGLNGNLDSHYVNGMLAAITSKGWRGIVMHFRGCSGIPNRLARSYHSGETGDLQTIVNMLIKRESESPLFVIGYSLGGNVLLKALGENVLNNNVQAAVAVSVPFELNRTADHLCNGFSKIYQWRLVNELKRSHRKKFLNVVDPLKIKNLASLRTFWQFDNAITAPLHGFKNAAEYYSKSSSRQYLNQITTPTLILHSRDDPFTPLDSIPSKAEVSKFVDLELTDQGGHVGFVSGNYPWQPQYWLENRILNYFDNRI